MSSRNYPESTPNLIDENDTNNNNVDEGFENDNISVTGSPLNTNSTEDDEKRSPSPPTAGTGGAFTALIHRKSPTALIKKSDFLSGFSSQLPQPPGQAFNHALAAQLFLQSPLIPQPSQWLYSQIYNSYNDMPWFRNTIPNTFRSNLSGDLEGMNLVKRSVTLISHQDAPTDIDGRATSPPVSSTAPPTSSTDLTEVTTSSSPDSKRDNNIGPIRSRSPKHTDVWRPY